MGPGVWIKAWFDLPSGSGGEAQVTGTIMDVKTKKKSGKKPGKYFDVAYEQRYGLPNEWIHVSDVKLLLV